MEKVLLILDSEDTRKLLTEALTDYEVAACSAGESAAVLAQFRPDALILDLFLPGTDGLSILENCRELLPPVVLPLTVLVSDYIRQKAAQLGAGFVIQKPCSIDYIVKRLTDMLLLQRVPQLPDDTDAVDRILNRFQLHGKPRVLAALRTAILIALRDPDCPLTKEIYPVLCKEYGSSENAVDQAIRRMLQKTWEQRGTNAAIWEALFPGYTECPGNGDFISTLANYLRTRYPSRFTEPL